MTNLIRWRDQQIGSFIGYDHNQVLLAQEKVMLDFVCQFPQVRWLWLGDDNNFKTICSQLVQIATTDCAGAIIYGNRLHRLCAKDLIEIVKQLTAGKDYVYLGINRYEIIGHDFAQDLPDSIEDAIDCIVTKIHGNFRRLAKFPQVDGKHMVFAHPMDCYGLCK